MLEVLDLFQILCFNELPLDPALEGQVWAAEMNEQPFGTYQPNRPASV